MMNCVLPVLLIFCTLGRKAFSILQAKDPKCRYRVHYPKVSWHTAYDVCSDENKTLAKVSSRIEMQLIDLVLLDVENIVGNLATKTDLQGVWIEGFRRSSNNESMQQNCRSIDPQLNIAVTNAAVDDILCLYYNYTDRQIYADNCDSSRPSLCESLTSDLEDCSMTNKITSVKHDKETSGLCLLQIQAADLDGCISDCFSRGQCYGIIIVNPSCYLQTYEPIGCDLPRNSESIIHKGIFIYHKNLSTNSPPKPFEDWCPEITKEVLQEKIENIQKNLTVNKKETNQYIRTLISAPDERQSAKNIGIVGVTVISVVFGVIMLSDCINVVRGIQDKCNKSEVS